MIGTAILFVVIIAAACAVVIGLVLLVVRILNRRDSIAVKPEDKADAAPQQGEPPA